MAGKWNTTTRAIIATSDGTNISSTNPLFTGNTNSTVGVSTGVTVAATTTVVLAANSTRKYAKFINDSDEVIYLSVDGTAILHKGIRLAATGGDYEMILGKNMVTGVIAGISTSGSKVLCVTSW